MAITQRIINTGQTPNDGSGDALRDSFIKVNENFGDLYNYITSREVISFTTSVMTPNSTLDVDVSVSKGYVLYRLETSSASWIRIYPNTLLRFQDSARLLEDEPPSSGLIKEIITGSDAVVIFTPAIYGFNLEETPTDNMPIKITNLSGASAEIEVSFLLVKIEN
jgi:hypothetical protein